MRSDLSTYLAAMRERAHHRNMQKVIDAHGADYAVGHLMAMMTDIVEALGGIGRAQDIVAAHDNLRAQWDDQRRTVAAKWDAAAAIESSRGGGHA